MNELAAYISFKLLQDTMLLFIQPVSSVCWQVRAFLSKFEDTTYDNFKSLRKDIKY